MKPLLKSELVCLWFVFTISSNLRVLCKTMLPLFSKKIPFHINIEYIFPVLLS